MLKSVASGLAHGAAATVVAGSDFTWLSIQGTISAENAAAVFGPMSRPICPAGTATPSVRTSGSPG